MAVLVNRYSASASEIVAASLQDHNRAVVIGERTWGKGSVQNVIELEGGKSALKLTTAGYMRPSGKKIHRGENDKDSDEWGVTPNESYRIRLDDGETFALASDRRARDVAAIHGKRGDAPKPEDPKPPKAGFLDRQLNKAIEYLESQFKAQASK
jgi:carboxyl-terminal processing protease